MKIIKSFPDQDFIERAYKAFETLPEYRTVLFWWGLGDDGELYSSIDNGKNWALFVKLSCKTIETNRELSFGLSMREIKLLDKEFGELVNFI